MNAAYTPLLKENLRVRLMKAGHREHSHSAIVLRALENPSRRPESQWYDVRFDDGVYGRFLGRYLEPIEGGMEKGGENLPGLQKLTAA